MDEITNRLTDLAEKYEMTDAKLDELRARLLRAEREFMLRPRIDLDYKYTL